MRVLFIGDIVGKAGRQALLEWLPEIRREHKPDFIFVNGENAAGGNGITPQIAEEFYDAGIDAITLGNHAWDKREVLPYIDGEKRLLRPLNYPGHPPGAGSVVLSNPRGQRIALISLAGRVFSPTHYDCPFRAADGEIGRISGETPAIMVDFHAEATSEKVAMGWYLDGRASAVLGTHTHIQTADEQVLPGGTAFITDLGMTGPRESVIGIKKELVLERFLTQMPVRFEAAKGPRQLCGAIVEIEEDTGKARDITRIFRRE